MAGGARLKRTEAPDFRSGQGLRRIPRLGRRTGAHYLDSWAQQTYRPPERPITVPLWGWLSNDRRSSAAGLC